MSELLDAFRAGDGVDLIRDAVQLVLQELIEIEATEQIGAARYERTDTRVTERNGSRPRLLATQAGDIELRIPKLRKGSFFPSDPGAAPADRPGALRGGDGGLRQRRVDPLGRRPGRRARGRRRGSRSPRCHGSAPASTRSSARSAPAASITSSSPTSTSTPPTCTSATPASQVCSMAVVIATGITATGEREVLGCRRRRLRRRGVLARLPALAASPRAGRGAAGDLRPARRPRRRPAPLVPGRRPSTLPGPLRPQPARPRPQVASGHGRRGVPHDLRPTRRRHRRRRPGTRSATSSATGSPRSPC